MAYYIKKFATLSDYETFKNNNDVLPLLAYITATDEVKIDKCILPEEDIDLVKEYIERKGTSLVIPSGATKIGEYAYRACPYTTITVPEGVTSIGANAFRATKNNNTVYLPSTITSIGATAFETKTQSIILRAQTPPSIVSSSIKTSTQIYVPASSVSTYQATNIWKNYTINAIQE